jgi:hypothetical protein
MVGDEVPDGYGAARGLLCGDGQATRRRRAMGGDPRLAGSGVPAGGGRPANDEQPGGG